MRRRSLVLVLTAAVSTAGCPYLAERLASERRPPARADAQQTPRRTEPPRPPQPVASAAQPIEESRARWIDETLFEAARPVSTRPLRVPGWSVFSALERQRKLILGRRVGRRTQTALYDLEAERIAAERYGEPHMIDHERGFFTVYGDHANSTTYVSVATGAVITPTLVGEDGATLALYWATLDVDNGMAVAIGRSADGTLRGAIVDLERPNEPTRALTRVAFAPTSYAFAGATDALDLIRPATFMYAQPARGYECVRLRFSRDGQARCVAYGQITDDRYSGTGRAMLLGSWFFDDHAPHAITNVETREERPTPMPRGSRCQTLKQLRIPPRSLITCADGSERAYYLWSPERWLRWTEPSEQHYRMGDLAQSSETIASLESSIEGPVDAWVDMERGQLVRTELLEPLRFSRDRDRTVFLQRRNDRSQLELIVLDLDARTLRVIARFSDCAAPGYLATESEHDGLLVFGCQVQPQEHLFRFRYRWTRAVDMKTERLYSLSGQATALLADRREVIISSSSENAAESDLPQGALTRVQLVAPGASSAITAPR